MKIIVFSDSHRVVSLMAEAVRREKPDLILHLGDHASDAEQLSSMLPAYRLAYVRGNCDRDSQERDWLLLTEQGVKIFATHGHLYRVRGGGLQTLFYAAKEKGAGVALFGHTHSAVIEEKEGLIIMNPGTAQRTYGVFTVENGKAGSFEIKPMPYTDEEK